MNRVCVKNIGKYINYTIREGRVDICINNTAFANLLIRDILSLDILYKPLVYMPSACAICTWITYTETFGTNIDFLRGKWHCGYPFGDLANKPERFTQIFYHTYIEVDGPVFSLIAFYGTRKGYPTHRYQNIDYTQAAVLSWALKLPQRLALQDKSRVSYV